MSRRVLVGDFETTVYNGQTRTDVWASAIAEIGKGDEVQIFGSIDETYQWIKSQRCNLTIYYHNLKFDSSFWLDYLLKVKHFTTAGQRFEIEGQPASYLWDDRKDMPNNSMRCIISSQGQYYSILLKIGGHYVELRDSYKLMPMSVSAMGPAFNTRHRKLEIEYEGLRYPGCPISEQEKAYIANDVLVVKEALEQMFKDGHNKLTIGACCLAEFKSWFTEKEWDFYFPDVSEIELDSSVYGSENVDEYIRKSYKGGWCYVVKGKKGKVLKNGLTADVNSLYPSVMSSESGCRYPIGMPTFWRGNDIPEDARLFNRIYFVRFRCTFRIKDGYLPFVQIKHDLKYNPRECLETSDVYNFNTGEYTEYYLDIEGNPKPAWPELTMSQVDFELFQEHYHVEHLQILDGCYFETVIGIFDEYINKYKKIKMESTGGRRTEAKLFSNNLYGKLASGLISSFKVPYVTDNQEQVYFENFTEFNRKPVYIPAGAMVTSWARNFTIRHAQMNYHGDDKPGFAYADTDSLHIDGMTEDGLVGIDIHPTNYCCWKIESHWTEAIFARQKGYIEILDNGEYDVKCAGMGDKPKALLVESITGKRNPDIKHKPEEEEWIQTRRTLEDFKAGLEIPGNLKAKRINGGILLTEQPFKMRKSIWERD